jgi:trimeric autotransporter adhesin
VLVNHTGSSGNIAVFQNSSANVARIDKTGRGFFNNGTQLGGADLAEAFSPVRSISGKALAPFSGQAQQ